MTQACTVIIPVYNAFEEACVCVRSVLCCTDSAVRILVIDDASPSGDFAEVLRKEVDPGMRAEVVRNGRNLGYVGSCNRGMRLAGEDDVVLLNSDTEVTPRWLEKLGAAAYSRPNIGTVSPFTNNGVLCSIPRFCRENAIPAGMSIDEFAAAIEAASRREYPELPTCMGFCVYIPRRVLERVGLFDEATFGRGNGEENDFSCRAQAAGFVDILDDATFVYHKGNASFLELKNELMQRNGRLLHERHPHYFDNVSKFCSRDPLRPMRMRVLDPLARGWNTGKPRVLHVLQNGPYEERRDVLGGTERHVQDLIEHIREAAHWTLVPGRGCYWLSAHFPGGERSYVLPFVPEMLQQVIRPEYFDVVHLHHPRWFDLGDLHRALAAHGNYVVSLHDFALICPRFHLLTPDRRHCTGVECRAYCGIDQERIRVQRHAAEELLSGARTVICFSNSTRDYVERIIPGSYRWQLIRHGIGQPPGNARRAAAAHEKGIPLKAVFLGFVAPHKGSRILDALLRHAVLPGGTPVEWHLIGELMPNRRPANLIQHGRYERGELRQKLKALSPHVAVILSLCPETYCLTLDEAWSAGIPAVVTPLGAPAERVRESGAGWVLPELSPGAVLTLLGRIAGCPEEYLQARSRAEEVPLLDAAAEAAEYARVYRGLLGAESSPAALFEAVQPFAETSPPRPSRRAVLAASAASKAVYILDALGVRGAVQRLVAAILPARIFETLKAAR